MTLGRHVRTGVFVWLADFDVFIQLLTFNPFIACFPLVSKELNEMIECPSLSSQE